MRNFLILILLVLVSGCYSSNESANQEKDVSPRYQVHRTKNFFTFLLLDTRKGGLWQVQYALDKKDLEGDVPLSSSVLTDNSGYNGRFSLTSTENMWTYMLTDTKTGAMWHCQFTIKQKEYRGCYQLVGPKGF